MIAMSTGIYAQNPTITLTFTAKDNSQHLPLDSILIENLSQGGDTTLYAPDTVLVLDYLIGIGDIEPIGSNIFTISQNYPNPIEGKTTVSLYMSRNENVLITVSDIMGRKLINMEYHLGSGSHFFTFFPGKESLYFLTVQADHQSRTVKMFNSPCQAFNSSICKLEYNEQQTSLKEYKSGNALGNFVFAPYDLLEFTAFTNLGEKTITSSPGWDETYIFYYFHPIPCPGMPTVLDIDGNIYNTIQIGDQCWMKENLKTTTYNDGTLIPNVTDENDWFSISTGAYVWYDNDITWKDKYGALYNWHATVDADGLCPTGWHVPTNDEWIALTNFIGGIGYPHGNELKSCNQVNSPLGGFCNTSDHPRWDEDINNGNFGTDDYGFSGLPGGSRTQLQGFYSIGYVGNWWSSTYYSGSDAWYRSLVYNLGTVNVSNNNVLPIQRRGHSVRCLWD